MVRGAFLSRRERSAERARGALSWLLLFVGLTAASEASEDSSVAQLADAVAARDAGAIDALLEAGAALDARQVDGMTALHWAVHHDDATLVRRLLEAGARADVANEYGVRPLSTACRSGSGDVVKMLLDAGAKPDVALEGGESPLHTAARTGRLAPVELLIERGAEVDARERRGQTPLMWAAAAGHARVARRLLEAGADGSARVRSGFTAMFFAARQGHIDVVRVLLEDGEVDPRAVKYRGRVDEDADAEAWDGPAKRDGKSALLLAVENAHYELALVLLEAEGGVDANDERSGETPLHAVVSARKTGRGDGADGNPPPAGSGRVTSLEFVERLVGEHGADVNRRLEKGRSGRGVLSVRGATPLLLAARNADVPLMKKLLELGADPHIPNAEGATALLAAAGLGTLAPGEEPGSEGEALEALRILLDLGLDIDAVDAKGETAMHGAAYKSAPRIVEFLAKEGASMELWNRPNDHSWTPLHIAEGHRPGNFKPSTDTVAALHRVFRAAGREPPPPRRRGAGS